MAEPIALKYRAFISYSHADTSWAKWLHRGLESFRIDKDLVGRETATGAIPKTLRPIFRDRDAFTAGHTLGEQTLAALDASAAMIVICSPASAKSHYVNEEIRLFKSRHAERPVIPLIVGGEPGDPELECFPSSLKFKLDAEGQITSEPVEVLAADVREQGDGKTLALAKVVAGLLDLSADDVFRRAERERRRKGRVRNGIIGIIAALILIGGFFGWQAQQRQRTLAEVQAIVATYSSVDNAEGAPGAEQSLTAAITSIAQSAARDPRYATALDLLKAGKPQEAEPLLEAVAEDKKKLAAKQIRKRRRRFVTSRLSLHFPSPGRRVAITPKQPHSIQTISKGCCSTVGSKPRRDYSTRQRPPIGGSPVRRERTTRSFIGLASASATFSSAAAIRRQLSPSTAWPARWPTA